MQAQVDVRALKQALWRSLQSLRAKAPDNAELDFQVDHAWQLPICGAELTRAHSHAECQAVWASCCLHVL